MRLHTGWVREVRVDASGAASAWVVCPENAVPVAGAYLLASEEQAILPTPLFLEAAAEGGFIAAPPLPHTWEPGMRLALRGPLGHGFRPMGEERRLGLVSLGETVSRLLPLAEQALARGAEVALFTDISIAGLPSAVEISPLSSLADAIAWADFLALDVPMAKLEEMGDRLGRLARPRIPCPAQVLVSSPMPCGGVAECGVCAVQAGRRWKLICKDGPVFNLEELITR